jgi:hypothetical protein
MSLTGPPKATFLYPRITFGTTPVTLDNAEPTSRIPTIVPDSIPRGENTVATGKREYLSSGRVEEQVGLALRCEQDQLAALRWFVRDWAGHGNQFKAWVDRYTGSCWVLETNRKDQNGLMLSLSGITETYAPTGFDNRKGLSLSGAFDLHVALAQASAVIPTGFDDPFAIGAGVLVMDVHPAFAGNDSTLHVFLDTGPSASNRMILRKSAANTLQFEIVDNASAVKTISTTATWSINDRVNIVVDWDAGTLGGWHAVNGGAWTSISTLTGAGTGVLTTLPTTLYIGSDNVVANRAAALYDTVTFFKQAFANPHLSLANFRPVEKNYFPYAEMISAQFQPGRVTLGRPIWDWPIAIRNGQP